MRVAGKKSILVIDDSASIRLFIRGLLEEANYNVCEASDGVEGLDRYRSEDVDLIITDVYMPRKTGLEFVVDLRKENKEIKVIVLSDGGETNFSNDLGIVEALGATCFIKKDLIKEKLLEVVNESFIDNED